MPRPTNNIQLDQLSAHSKRTGWDRLKNEGIPRLLSDLLNPLIVPPIVLGLMAWQLGSSTLTISWISAGAAIFYTIIPLACTLHLLRTDQITSLDLPSRQSRYKLFLTSIGSATLATGMFWLLISPMNQLIVVVSLVFLVNMIVGYLINRSWKISIHAAGLASAGSIFLFLSQLTFIGTLTGVHILSLGILLLLLPLVIWARHQLNVHTPAELLGGVLAGFVFTIIELSILTSLW